MNIRAIIREWLGMNEIQARLQNIEKLHHETIELQQSILDKFPNASVPKIEPVSFPTVRAWSMEDEQAQALLELQQ